MAQLYLRFPDVPGVPRIALRGFQRVALKAGERREVTFRLTARDLSSVSPEGAHRIATGPYRLFVGGGQPGDAPRIDTLLTIGREVALPN